MRRIAATCLVGVLALTACTDDAEQDVGPTETPSETASTTEPDDETTAEPSEDETSEEATEAEATSSPTEDATDGDAPEDDETATEAAAPSPSPEAAPALASPGRGDVAVGTTGSAFAADDDRTRRRGTGSCPVQPASDEQVVSCVTGFARTDGGRQTAVVVSRVDGREDVTVYDDAGDSGWRSTLVARDVPAAPEVRLAPWAGRDDAFVVAYPDRDELVLTGDGGSRVGGVLRDAAGREVTYVARRVVVRNGDTIEVLAPTADGLAGTATTATDGAAPEDVALRLYSAWVSGDLTAAADLATDDVVAALEATPVDSDVFALDGTTCPVTDGVATCTFAFDDTVLRWHVEATADGVRVTDLD